jgi:hypothetical protein
VIIRNASKIALLTDENAAVQWSAIAHDRRILQISEQFRMI